MARRVVGDLLCGLPVFRSDERRVFSAHHHRASRVDGDDLCSSLDERQQDSQVHLHAAAKRLQVAALPRRHAATFETVGATDIDTVAFKHLDGIAADLRFVVLHIACLKQDGFAAGLRSYFSGARSPSLEGRAGKLGKQLVAMNTENLLQEDSMQADAIGHVGDTQTRARCSSGAVGIAEDAIAQAESFTAGFLRNVALHQTWKIQFELVSVALAVGTLDLTELTLKARVHHFGCLGSGDLPNIAVLPVYGGKKTRKAVTVFEAETAPVADLEGPPDLLVERLRIPVFCFRGIIGEPVCGLVGDVLRLFHPRSRSRNGFQIEHGIAEWLVRSGITHFA